MHARDQAGSRRPAACNSGSVGRRGAPSTNCENCGFEVSGTAQQGFTVQSGDGLKRLQVASAWAVQTTRYTQMADQNPWPTFPTSAALAAKPDWNAYLFSVYGALPPAAFPFNTSHLSFLYYNTMPAVLRRRLLDRPILGSKSSIDWRTGVAHHPRDVRCPYAKSHDGQLTLQPEKRSAGEAYAMFGGAGGVGRGAATVWRYLPGASTVRGSGLSNFTRVEVYHCSEPSGSTTTRGELWMYLAPGSGVYYDLGKTAVLSRHHIPSDLRRTEEAVERSWLRGEGFDSVQYTRRFEDCIYKFEIVDLRHRDRAGNGPGVPRVGACPPKPILQHFGSGWGGVRSCRCSKHMQCLHCGGAGSQDMGARQVMPPVPSPTRIERM